MGEEGTMDYTQLDPGIRKLVKLLRENGFETTDSGDGKTKGDLGLDYPHVHIKVVDDPKDGRFGDLLRAKLRHRPEALLAVIGTVECERLAKLLAIRGVSFDRPGEGPWGVPEIQMTYGYPDRMVFISLLNVDDSLGWSVTEVIEERHTFSQVPLGQGFCSTHLDSTASPKLTEEGAVGFLELASGPE